MLKVDRVSLGTTICQRFTNVSCLRSHHKEKTGTRSIPEVKPCRARDSTWMVDRLEIPRIVDSLLLVFLFLLHDENDFSCFQRCVVFVKQRENQIVLTIGALLHYTDVEL